MKKLFIIALLIPQMVIAQKLEKYCEVVAIGKLFSTKVNITIDFGEARSFFKDTRMRDSLSGEIVKFNSLIDALNYMGTQSWKLVNAFPISSGGNGNVLHFYFKKEYDSSELSPGK